MLVTVATIYKNQLQEYTQKVGKRLPIYQSFNEGSENFPRHRAKVLVDGVEYTSKLTHSTKKQAEQEVAKIAYESIFHEETEVVSFPFLYKDPTLCKSILNEFAIKKKMKPTYNMGSQAKGKSPAFICHLTFGGKTYIGEEAGNKKLAEHLAARTAIESLLETNADTLSPIIMSKVNSDDYLPKCSGNLQGESSSRHKRNANINNEGRNKKRRFGN
ncbi:double-stranded RNA-binding protein 4-like [Solanum verrucosum]|uniref:double-stranded RNA-binding protein 4-like n=1 Tax=Solanum verrucosum TaxID=315347 RepID=UPI0020D15E32|nr:double-stranded RNA-binding protein 4-like [Solanum verrucosum]